MITVTYQIKAQSTAFNLRKSCHCAVFSKVNEKRVLVRTVPTIVIAHMFCASRNSQDSYGSCLLMHGYILRGLKLCGENRTKQVLLVSKKKIGGKHVFFKDN